MVLYVCESKQGKAMEADRKKAELWYVCGLVHLVSYHYFGITTDLVGCCRVYNVHVYIHVCVVNRCSMLWQQMGFTLSLVEYINSYPHAQAMEMTMICHLSFDLNNASPLRNYWLCCGAVITVHDITDYFCVVFICFTLWCIYNIWLVYMYVYIMYICNTVLHFECFLNIVWCQLFRSKYLYTCTLYVRCVVTQMFN